MYVLQQLGSKRQRQIALHSWSDGVHISQIRKCKRKLLPRMDEGRWFLS
jgi:hypothetical protein